MSSSPDSPGEDEQDEPILSAVIEALISMDPYLSDFEAGT